MKRQGGSIVLAGKLAKVKGARHTWFPREITPAERHSLTKVN